MEIRKIFINGVTKVIIPKEAFKKIPSKYLDNGVEKDGYDSMMQTEIKLDNKVIVILGVEREGVVSNVNAYKTCTDNGLTYQLNRETNSVRVGDVNAQVNKKTGVIEIEPTDVTLYCLV